MQRPLERHPVAGGFISAGHSSHSTFWSSDSTYATVLSSLSLHKPKKAVGNHSRFRITSSGTQRAPTELRIDNPNKGETNGYFIDRYFSVVFDRWRGLGIFSLAPVAPAAPLPPPFFRSLCCVSRFTQQR